MGFFRIVIHFKEESLVEPKVIDPKYHTRVIITRSRFETALDYKPQIFKVKKVSLYYKPLSNTNHK